jgi:aryl-alcohol dehydrogenase-like predicted oxidoreductase
VQSPEEATAALACSDVRHLQLPFNLLDWRWTEAGIVENIRSRAQVTIHARSVFLQGLLAADDASIWPRIDDIDAAALISTIAEIARDFGRDSAADLCVAYARGQDWIDGVVVGMETEDQLDDNLRLFLRPPLSPADCADVARRLPRVSAQLLNPAQWPQKS